MIFLLDLRTALTFYGSNGIQLYTKFKTVTSNWPVKPVSCHADVWKQWEVGHIIFWGNFVIDPLPCKASILPVAKMILLSQNYSGI
jgi:hypothetical protein